MTDWFCASVRKQAAQEFFPVSNPSYSWYVQHGAKDKW